MHCVSNKPSVRCTNLSYLDIGGLAELESLRGPGGHVDFHRGARGRCWCPVGPPVMTTFFSDYQTMWRTFVTLTDVHYYLLARVVRSDIFMQRVGFQVWMLMAGVSHDLLEISMQFSVLETWISIWWLKLSYHLKNTVHTWWPWDFWAPWPPQMTPWLLALLTSGHHCSYMALHLAWNLTFLFV